MHFFGIIKNELGQSKWSSYYCLACVAEREIAMVELRYSTEITRLNETVAATGHQHGQIDNPLNVNSSRCSKESADSSLPPIPL